MAITASAGTTATTSNKKRRRNDAIIFWFMVGPVVLGLLLFIFTPIVWGFLVSLHKSRGTVNLEEYVGLANYYNILTDEDYLKSLLFITQFSLFIVPVTYALSLFLAVMVQNAAWGKGVFRTIFFMPTAISYVIAAMIWRMAIFSGLPYGFANWIIWITAEIEPIAWIGTIRPPWHYMVLVTVRLWLQVGFYMILFIAGMQDIPQEMYEAARVDGAESKWTLFRHITFPLLRNTSIFVLLVNLVHAFQAFAEFYNILGATWTAGGLLSLARPPLLYLYQVAMNQQFYGTGTAGAFILVLIIFVVTVIQSRLTGGLGKEV